MDRTLYILRHAKSSWENTALPDFDRPLNERGLGGARLVGNYLKSINAPVSLVVSSPARRTTETTRIVIESSGFDVPVKFDERIYEASLRHLLEVLSDIDDKEKAVLLVGHNPGMEQLVECLTLHEQSMPTAALAKVALNVGSWQGIKRGAGELEWSVTPKTLRV
jgi:phosphohistidine phosphatase